MTKLKTGYILLIVMLLAWTTCQVKIITLYGDGPIGLEAVVLCGKLTIRQEPNSASKAVNKLPYGYVFSV